LLGRCQEEQFFKKAPTQELLCNMLLACVEKWQDYNYILDLLRYDWLRCSHRYLPEKLKVPEEMSSKSLKKKLFKMSDDAVFIEGTSSERTYCLKKGFFLKFSNRFIEEQGFLVKDGKHFLCFLPEREPGFYQFNRVAQFIVKENT
jgi:hypothetical protein